MSFVLRRGSRALSFSALGIIIASLLVPAACASSRPTIDLGDGHGTLATARAAVDVERYRTDIPEARAASVPTELSAEAFARPDSGIPRLVSWLLEGQTDPYLKAKILHDWEALAIRYDVKAFYSDIVPDQSWQAVLKRRTAVCAGYSALYKALCDQGGVECSVVVGSARGPGDVIADHAWNAVGIDGVRRLVDVTWDSSYVNSPTDNGQRYMTAYFLLGPEAMIYTHFPASARMQLLDRPISLAEFRNLPFADGLFLSVTREPLVGLALDNESKGFCTITIPHSPEARLSASVERVEPKASMSWGQPKAFEPPSVESEGGTAFTIAFPERGDYIVSIAAWRGAAIGQEIGDEAAAKAAIAAVRQGFCRLRFHSSGADSRQLVGFSPAFQLLAGLPSEGGILDSNVGAELCMTFGAKPGLKLEAGLSRNEGASTRRVDGGTAVFRVPEGYRVLAAFPEEGTYTLSLAASVPGAAKAWTELGVTAKAAAGHGYLALPDSFVALCGEPRGGLGISDRAGAEFSLTFPAPAGVEIEAHLNYAKEGLPGYWSYVPCVDRHPRCVADRWPDGVTVKAAFPEAGTYYLELEAKGPEGEKASAGFRLRAGSGTDRGYAHVDPELAELAGRPKLCAPDGANAVELDSDVVGSRIDLLFPGAGADLVATLAEMNSRGFDWLGDLERKRTSYGTVYTAVFPKPGSYVIFFERAGTAKPQRSMSIWLVSR